jgi:hypothetical protein
MGAAISGEVTWGMGEPDAVDDSTNSGAFKVLEAG